MPPTVVKWYLKVQLFFLNVPVSKGEHTVLIQMVVPTVNAFFFADGQSKTKAKRSKMKKGKGQQQQFNCSVTSIQPYFLTLPQGVTHCICGRAW